MSNPAKPRFSVVTCSYNQAQYLPDTIESVVAQDYPDFEHIVVDGGSKDNSREVCGRYPHIQFINAPGTTQAEALNIGFAKAKGDIIAWVNSDDYYAPQAFRRVAQEMDPARGRHIVAGAAMVVNAEGHPMWQLRNGHVGFYRLLLHPRLYPYNGWTVMPCQPSVFFHRSVYEKLGPLDGKLRYALDYEYWLRALAAGYEFHYVPQIFSKYRYHATSHSTKGFDTFLDEWKAASERYRTRLSRAEQAFVEAWWVYGRIESLLVRQHKDAIRHIAQRFGHAPQVHPAGKRALVILRAMLIAPWIPITLAWRSMRGDLKEPPRQAGDGAELSSTSTITSTSTRP
jgi:glycosyltransferase involved in cell wall biosynthesis